MPFGTRAAIGGSTILAMSGTTRRLTFPTVTLLLAAATTRVAALEPPAEGAFKWDAALTADALRVESGVVRSTALGHLDVRLGIDAAKLFGWSGTTLRIEAIADQGGKPNGRVGTLQGISNIEVRQNAVRLYATWIETEVGQGVKALAGLYDLNSEFYATDASSTLVHPAFGIGAELGQTGKNGPSIFPALSFGVRLKAEALSGFYAQGAVLDAVPGDPNHLGRTEVRLSRGEGALLVAEAGWQESGADGPGPRRWGLGLWDYTRPAPGIEGAGTARNFGAYGLVQGPMFEASKGKTVAFIRAGLARGRVNAIDAALDAGLMVERPWGESGPSSLSAGVAIARLGREHRNAEVAAGRALRALEAALEIDVRWLLRPGLTMQPLVQRVWNVAGRPGTVATVVGARWIWSLGDAGN